MHVDEWLGEHDNASRVTEHGQDWLNCGACGAIASVNDLEDDCEEAETIDYGDGSCHERREDD